MKKDKEPLNLTVGSTYHIHSLGSREAPIETKGKFVGFSIMGNAEALCIELDKSHKKLAGKVRMIPSHMILTLDILSEAKEKDKSEEDSTARSYL